MIIVVSVHLNILQKRSINQFLVLPNRKGRNLGKNLIEQPQRICSPSTFIDRWEVMKIDFVDGIGRMFAGLFF